MVEFYRILVCAVCGKNFCPRGNNQICCSSECYRVRQKMIAKEKRMELKAAKIESEKMKREIPSIVEIEKLARMEGMTYGKYALKHGI